MNEFTRKYTVSDSSCIASVFYWKEHEKTRTDPPKDPFQTIESHPEALAPSLRLGFICIGTAIGMIDSDPHSLFVQTMPFLIPHY